MIRLLTSIAFVMVFLSDTFASDVEGWVRQFGVPTSGEAEQWNRQATDFLNTLAREDASDEDRRLHEYFFTLPDLNTPTGDECVVWFKEFRPDVLLAKQTEALYHRNMNRLWKYVSANGCWTATRQARQSEQWSYMTCAADIIRLIRGYLGVGAKY